MHVRGSGARTQDAEVLRPERGRLSGRQGAEAGQQGRAGTRLPEQLAGNHLWSRLLWAHLPRATSNPCPWSRHVDGGCGPTCCAFWDRRRHALVSAVLRFFSSMHGNCEWGHACVMCEPPGSVLSVARRSDRCCGVWYCNIVGKSVRWEFLDAAPVAPPIALYPSSST